jgi:hypothetical protein
MNDIDDELAELNAAFDALFDAIDAAQPDDELISLLTKRTLKAKRAVQEADPTLKIVTDENDRFVVIRTE